MLTIDYLFVHLLFVHLISILLYHLLNYVSGPTGIRTQVRGFKVPGANHYTIRPYRSLPLVPYLSFLTSRSLPLVPYLSFLTSRSLALAPYNCKVMYLIIIFFIGRKKVSNYKNPH